MRVLTRAMWAVVVMGVGVGVPHVWAGQGTSNPYDWGTGNNAITPIGQPRYNQDVSPPTGSLFVHPLPSTPNPNHVTFMDYAWGAYTPTTITTCSKYITDPKNGNSVNCCIGTHSVTTSGVTNLVMDTDYGHCSSSTQHNCPGIYSATCNAACNADSANGGGSCPAYVTTGGVTVWPKCRPAESHCHSSSGHCWGTIGCYSSSANTAGTEVPCPPGGFFDQNSEGKPHIYHEGDFCFQNGASHTAKWCGSNTCSPGYGLDSTGTSCVACGSPSRPDGVGTCCPAIYDIINGICCFLTSHAVGSCTATSGTHGDPQISGFQGQSFQFHGLADEIFNLISTPSLQLNGHFAYLSSGKCNYNDTQCWTHPGTYIDQMGFAFGDSRMKLFAGSHDSGMHVSMNDEVLPLGNYKLTSNDSVVTIRYNEEGTIYIKTSQFHFKIMNSDMFFNMEASLLDHHLLRIGAPKHSVTDTQLCKKDHLDRTAFEKPTDETIHNHGAVEAAIERKYGGLQVPLHGLVGQTWRNVIVCGKHWVGGVSDYVTSDLFASDYFFNFFETDEE